MNCKHGCMYLMETNAVDQDGRPVYGCRINKVMHFGDTSCVHYKEVVMVYDTFRQIERPSNRKERRHSR